ncbi:hypothetical protein KQ306_10730 [Synechococcus sp. CS-1324]|uniref:hypothetical protein n=1 Tax=unclassified Synechococcus TaxID=2626047 RepID=UPI000DB13216|nr:MULTISPECIES: hypothetical protein [unclassified Synechococcus]MCT0214209.1 hypothetical protein [Synechococcus sp. CS-1326]MCT0231322.1 hypothetical protein [Synechococcus sp. CS-1324]MCT0232539.1 hypothetical protein [Synechococcus sp. CS-1327]PZV04697.1 MAG: hypothetical protein DCF23_05625 [Cyanobium sp.]
MGRIRLVALPLFAPWFGLMILGCFSAAQTRELPTYPSSSTLREVQLATFACSRSNAEADCSRARSLANPLMDNPLLPSFCKDGVWEILQKAQPAAANSFERRDALDQAGERLVSRCQAREKARPATKPPAGQGPSGPGGGSGFGIGPSRN